MKKSLFIIAAAAMMTACTSEVLREDYQKNDVNEAIDFATFVQKAVNTRATSENNGMPTTTGLENYHTSFQVWGYKFNTGIASCEAVFTGKEVKYNYVASADAKSWNYTSWTYTPVAYWDKSAQYYEFYAAAPKSSNWQFNDNKFSYANFSLAGISLAPVSGDANAKAIFPAASGDIDLMISNDVKNYSTYKTDEPVEFNFNHILARLNISVRAKNLASGDVCYLNEVKVYNMMGQGSFNEASAEANASGDCNRWSSLGNPYNSGVGYTSALASGDALTESPMFFYRALCIPQEIEYASGDCPLNGNGVGASTKPYLNIKFAINEDKYSYYYNLADLFNGKNSSADIKFCEGWMNTLHIIISPDIINFDAETFDWNEKEYQYTLPK